MKARKLKAILNNTGYILSDHRDYIAVGSPLCHNLLSIDKKELKIKIALDTWNEGRKSIKNPEIEFIYDKLQELIDSGEIKDIIEGKDIIDKPLPVFLSQGFDVIESVTDAYGWPNTDEQGRQLYNNTSFKTRSEAIIYTLSELGYGIRYSEERIAELVSKHNKEIDLRTEMLKKKEMLEKELQDSNIKIQSREEKHEG
jgi:hypothetical protein